MIRRFLHRLYLVVIALVILTAGSGLAWALQQQTSKLPLHRYFSTEHTNAVWDWSSPQKRSAGELSQLADFMYQHQLNATYVDIGDAVPIIKITDEHQRAEATAAYYGKLAAYVTALNKRGGSCLHFSRPCRLEQTHEPRHPPRPA